MNEDEAKKEMYEMVEAHLTVVLIAVKEAVETVQASLAQVKHLRLGNQAGGDKA